MSRRAVTRYAVFLSVALACNSDGGSEPGPKAADILVDPPSVSIQQRESLRIIPTVVDAAGTLISGVPVTFVSSNPAIATVSNIGLVTSVGPAGTTTVSVRAAGLTKAVPVTVVGVPTSISVSPSPGVVSQKGTLQLDAKLLDLDGVPISGATFTYASSNTPVATVSASGLVTSVGPAGSAVITVTSSSLTKAVSVAVTAVPTTLRLAPSTLTMGRNSTSQIRPVVLDAVGAEIPNIPTVSYTSSAPQIVSVSASGVLTSVAVIGSATITGRLDQLAATMTVTVVDAAHPIGDIVASADFNGYGAAIAGSGEFYVTGLGGVPVRGRLPGYATVTSVTPVRAGLAVVTNRSGSVAYFAGTDGVVAYDPAANQVRWTAAQAKGTPFDVVLSDDETTVYLTTGNGLVIAMDATTGAVKWETTLPLVAVHLALHPSKPLLYASGPDISAIAEIDLATHVATRINVGSSPQDIVVSPDGAELYIALESGGLDFLDLATRTRTTLSTPGCPGYGLIMTPDTEQLWIRRADGSR